MEHISLPFMREETVCKADTEMLVSLKKEPKSFRERRD